MEEKRNCQRCGAPLPAAGELQSTCPKCLMQLGLWASELIATGAGSVPPTPPEPELLARLLPDYEELELLGHGGMGVVYRGKHKNLARTVAIKVLPPVPDRDPSFAERFMREARALAGLNHPGIVTVYDFGEAEEHFYFAMEFVDGATLRQVMREGLEPAQALEIVQQVCAALQYAHDQGVVHRDVKPENILIDREGRVKLSDFGLAKLLGPGPGHSGLTHTFQVMGTPHYMAPEQFEHPGEVDHRADIFSLGVVFYELLTGELPLGRFSPPSGKVAIDVRLDEVVLRALEKEPTQRYQTAGAVKTEVDDILSGKPAAARPRGRAKRSWSPLLVAAAVLLGILFLGGAVGLTFLAVTRYHQAQGLAEALHGGANAPVPAPSLVLALEPLSSDDHTPRWSDEMLAELERRGLDDVQIEGAAARLQAVYADYLAVERQNSRLSVDEDGHLWVRLSPFPEARQRAQQALGELGLEAVLGASEVAGIARGLSAQLLAYGEDSVEVELWRDLEGVHVVESLGAQGFRTLRGLDEPPRRLLQFWKRSYLQPVSSWVPVQEFLDAAAAASDDAAQVRIATLRAEWYPESWFGADDNTIHVDFDVLSNDALTAAQRLTALQERLVSTPGVHELSSMETRDLSDTEFHGIRVTGLNFTYRLPEAGRRILPEEWEPLEDPTELAIRSVAAQLEEPLQGLELSRRDLWEGDGFDVEEWDIEFKDRAGHPLEALRSFVQTLEGKQPLRRITRVGLSAGRLSAPEDGTPQWRMGLTLAVCLPEG